jgi:hypothetical protein
MQIGLDIESSASQLLHEAALTHPQRPLGRGVRDGVSRLSGAREIGSIDRGRL